MDELLTRSIDKIYPTREALEKRLASGEKLRIYMGIDPTAEYVHLGHSTNYFVLKRFHKLGHKIIVLVGDFTAMIGDPSDKNSARRLLTIEEVKENLKTFKKQIGHILDFDNKENPIEFRFNSEWLAKLGFSDLVKLASNFTVQQMIKRDMFQKRLAENKDLFLHEFFYPLMQGYDSVVLEVDLEVGGTDQTFNMLAGRTLVKRYLNREKFVITTTLLEDPKTGEKLMSKSLGTGIGLNELPNDMFGKIMALSDSAIKQVFVDCTEVSIKEIETWEKEMKNPRDFKMRLGREIVKIYHGEEAAKVAEENFVKTFSQKEIPEQIEELKIESGKTLAEALLAAGLVKSKAEFRRLLTEKAVRDLSRDQIISDPDFIVTEPLVVRVGKHRFVKFLV